MEGTAKRLGLDIGYVMPAYEDPVHWLQKEAALPVNVDPSELQAGRSRKSARAWRGYSMRG